MNAQPKKLRTVLIRGPIVASKMAINNEATPAIAFAYISAYIRKKGYESTLIDAVGEGLDEQWALKKYPGFYCLGLNFEEIIKQIPKDIDVIGFSAMFSGEWPVLRDLILLIRECFPKALLVAGGEHITALSEYSLQDCSALDVCVRGEGEHTFYEVLEAWSEGSGFEQIAGVAYLDHKGEYRQNGLETPRIRKLEEIPWPNWPDGYLEKFWEAGKSYGVAVGRDMPFMFSRGCPYRCTFCSNEQMYTTRYVLRDIDDIIAEIKHYIDRYQINSIQLYDLTAITKKRWTIALCQRLLKEKIKLNWSLPSGTRSEVLDAETLEYLKKTGCNYLVYAPESGSPKTLERIKKRIKLENLTQSVIEAKRQGLIVRVNTIIGFPEESWKEIFQTVFYGLKLVMRGVDEVPLFIFSPYPGTAIFKKLREQDKIVINDNYFFSLASLNSAYLSTKLAVSYNPDLNPRILGMVRTGFILLNYAVSYLFYPTRIFRTIRNLRSVEAATVFEHRLKDLFKRKNVVSQPLESAKNRI